jgi:hypothetical protein
MGHKDLSTRSWNSLNAQEKSDRLRTVESFDNIELAMHIYEKGVGVTSIVTTNSDDRSLIGLYFNAERKARNKGDASVLKRFQNKSITDSDGKIHKFETDLDAIFEIVEQMEEPEFFEIYDE